jgi:hypothetical protein
MVILRIEENDYIVEVDQARLPLQSRQDDINGTLENCRGIPETKWHPKESVGSLVAGDRRLVRILRSKRNLPIATITVQSTEDTGIPERINTLVHARKRICIPDRHGVQLPVVDAKPHRTIWFGYQYDWTGPISACKLNDRFHLSTSMYRYARIDIPRLGSTFRFHTSHCHVTYIKMCDAPACHVSNCHVTHITTRDGNDTPRISFPSLITPSTQYL